MKANGNVPKIIVFTDDSSITDFYDFLKNFPEESEVCLLVRQSKSGRPEPEITAGFTSFFVQQSGENQRAETGKLILFPENNQLIIKELKLIFEKKASETNLQPGFHFTENSAPEAVVLMPGSRPILPDLPAKTRLFRQIGKGEPEGLFDGIYHLPAGALGDALAEWASRKRRPLRALPPVLAGSEHLPEIFAKIKAVCGTDFSDYKPSVSWRRIEKRMHEKGFENAAGYAKFLNARPDEAEIMHNRLLISITSFYRDPEALEACRRALAERIAAKTDKKIRIWSAGCASGEESCTLVYLLAKILGDDFFNYSIRIFGTDVNPEALEEAKPGEYGPESLEECPAELLDFLDFRQGKYSLPAAYRSCLTFERHELISGPVFTDLDLIVCRNVMIYFTEKLCNQVFNRFHEALKPSGLLFTGQTEGPGEFSELFRPLDRSAALFERINR